MHAALSPALVLCLCVMLFIPSRTFSGGVEYEVDHTKLEYQAGGLTEPKQGGVRRARVWEGYSLGVVGVWGT